MSLITRCPACATMFKVVPDQLRISAGWVRCGVCGEVFEAPSQMLSEADGRSMESFDPVLEGGAGPFDAVSEVSDLNTAVDGVDLVDTELAEGTGSPHDQNSHPPHEDAGLLTDSPALPEGPYDQDAGFADAPLIDDALFARLATSTGSADAEKVERVEARLNEVDVGEIPQLGSDPASPAESKWTPPAHLQATIQNATSPRELGRVKMDEWRQEEPDSPQVSLTPDRHDSSDSPDSAESTDERWWPRVESGVGTLAADEAISSTETVPSFVKQARRRAFFRSRGVRAALWLVMTLLVLGLGLQWAVVQRDWLAATEPRLAPLLESICRPMGCIVSPYRNLNAIVIDGSSFQRVASDSFRLNVSLRNNGDLPVAPPSLELTLTDAQDQVLLRRVVSADEMSAPQTLNAQGEFNGSSAVSVEATDSSAIVGYRLTAFYP